MRLRLAIKGWLAAGPAGFGGMAIMAIMAFSMAGGMIPVLTVWMKKDIMMNNILFLFRDVIGDLVKRMALTGRGF